MTNVYSSLLLCAITLECLATFLDKRTSAIVRILWQRSPLKYEHFTMSHHH